MSNNTNNSNENLSNKMIINSFKETKHLYYSQWLICWCGEIEDMNHIYNCELYRNNKKESISYNKIYNGKLEEQLEVFSIFKQNLEQRQQIITEIELPCDLAIRCLQ
jgi:hypothetical protein